MLSKILVKKSRKTKNKMYKNSKNEWNIAKYFLKISAILNLKAYNKD